MRQRHLTDLAINLLALLNFAQVCPPEVSTQITWGTKRMYAGFEKKVLLTYTDEAVCRSFVLVDRQHDRFQYFFFVEWQGLSRPSLFY